MCNYKQIRKWRGDSEIRGQETSLLVMYMETGQGPRCDDQPRALNWHQSMTEVCRSRPIECNQTTIQGHRRVSFLSCSYPTCFYYMFPQVHCVYFLPPRMVKFCLHKNLIWGCISVNLFRRPSNASFEYTLCKSYVTTVLIFLTFFMSRSPYILVKVIYSASIWDCPSIKSSRN